MRIIIMGTGPFAVPTCRQLLADGHQIALVVTRPLADPKAKKKPPRPVYEWASGEGLPVFEPVSINDSDAIKYLADHKPDLLFVCDYGQILSSECLSVAALGGINLHGSLLPRHRGAAPVQWAILRGDRETGVTVIHMTPRLDAGPALAVARTTIGDDETAEELEPRLAEIGIECTVRAISELEHWDRTSVMGEIQDKSLVTKASRLNKSDGRLDFRLPADYLTRLVRACQPWPATFAELSWPTGNRLRLIIRLARAMPNVPSSAVDLEPGAIRAVTAEQIGHSEWGTPWQQMLAVGTGDGLFLVGLLQPAGKRIMPTQDFLRGHPVEPGCRFVLPEAQLASLA